ncbi:MAG: hypothetical protein E3J43_07505 [Candidatus Heimdallarchaeota archaeon]|nr:MAG: hypothetical protein E3J43_07505 [Candidatus Heimdallarchaeota archaeon]
MHIVVNSKQERDILIQLFNSLEKKDMNFFLDFEDPLSLQIESIFDDLCSCEILIDKDEEPLGIV